MGAVAKTDLRGLRVRVQGVVQGVGFRPYVHRLATDLGLTGWVRNTPDGVEMALDGPEEALTAFVTRLQREAPPLAHIVRIQVEPRPPHGYRRFVILNSSRGHAQSTLWPPADVSICGDCLRELFDPTDRRYRYPFINCTNCGPRYTIIQALPYDRPNTSMRSFPMCSACAEEYHDPRDRRFHAQPVACPACGPEVWLETPDGERLPLRGDQVIQEARRALAVGRIVALKGLGGFHLACDAAIQAVVAELRRRKHRPHKPFAVMAATLDILDRYVVLDDFAAELLTSPQRPIVILPRRPGARVAPAVAPDQRTLGVMLPYTPLHYLLLEPTPDFPELLVMTSGNAQDEPIAYTNEQARQRLGNIADLFLFHNRPIVTPCDDSVVRPVAQRVVFLRRARGYAPLPLPLPRTGEPLLAVGGDLKNVFALARDDLVFLSQHIGDLGNYATYRTFEEVIAHLERLLDLRPRRLVADRHPQYLSVAYARRRAEREGLPLLQVQHHHAHLAACLADNAHPGDRPVLGVIFDGTGYGDDGAIWGGEFLLGDYRGFQRIAHLDYIPLPGGDRAIRQPWRTALAHLWAAGLPWPEDLPLRAQVDEAAIQALAHQLQAGVGVVPTSSMGRLFDAFAAFLGLCVEASHEAQAPMTLESLAEEETCCAYAFPLDTRTLPWRIGLTTLWRDALYDWRKGVPPEVMAAQFHNGLVRLVLEVAMRVRTTWGCATVALSGGVWQNAFLLERTVRRLRAEGFTVLLHRKVPPNDGGLALGQAAIACFVE